MRVSSIVLKSINDTLSWNIFKLALSVGIPLGLIWIGIGYLLWDEVVKITSYFISWIPFSILKANAAFLIGGFSWSVIVLATYAVIMALFNVPIYKFISEKKHEYFSLGLLIIIAILWTVFAIFNWDFVYKELEKALTWFPFYTLQEGVASLLAFLVFYNLYILSLYLVVMLFNGVFLNILKEKDYPDAVEIHEIKKSEVIKVITKDTIIFVLFLILSFPLFFVPFVNVFIQVFLWAWLIKEAYFLSASSLYVKKEQLKELNKHGFIKWGIAFLASLLNLLPIINIFAPFFAQTMFFHYVMQNKE